MIEISKELLSEVLNIKIRCFTDDSWLKSDNTIVFVCELEQNEDFINIYELAHKCKEWAYDNMYIISSCYIYGGSCSNVAKNQEYSTLAKFKENSEVEAIFKACEWILKEIIK